MSDMDPELLHGEGGDFEWVDDELSDSDHALLEKVEVPYRKKVPSPNAEIAVDLHRRLSRLRVENIGAITRWTVRKMPEELYMSAYAVEDVHYSVYERIRAKSKSPFISIKWEEIVAATPSDVSRLQIEQTQEANLRLYDLGIRKGMDKWTNGTPEQKFMLRSLDRLLKEKYLLELASRMRNEALQRGAARPLLFEEVALRSLRIFDRQKDNHTQDADQASSTDAKMWHLLETRNLERADSFADPLRAILPN